MATKKTCKTLVKVGESEEIFVLRAQDVFAPAVVDFWADMAENTGVCDIGRIESARRVASRMRRTTGRKLPD